MVGPVVGQLIGALCLVAVGLISLPLLADHGNGAMIFAVLLLAHPWLYNGVGMESFLTSALVLGLFTAYKAGRMTLAVALAALAFLARPDAVLAAAVVDYFVTQRRMPPMRVILTGLGIVLPWLGFSYAYLGEFIPLTLAAKSAQTATGYWGTGLIFLKGFLPTNKKLVLQLLFFGRYVLAGWRLSFFGWLTDAHCGHKACA